jgi:hypothetical protein
MIEILIPLSAGLAAGGLAVWSGLRLTRARFPSVLAALLIGFALTALAAFLVTWAAARVFTDLVDVPDKEDIIGRLAYGFNLLATLVILFWSAVAGGVFASVAAIVGRAKQP